MKKDTIIYQLKNNHNVEIQLLTNQLISFLDDFFYYYDLFSNTVFNEVFYYLYIEEQSYNYIDIASFVQKNHTMQIYRMFKMIENFIMRIILNEKRFAPLVEYLSTNPSFVNNKNVVGKNEKEW